MYLDSLGTGILEICPLWFSGGAQVTRVIGDQRWQAAKKTFAGKLCAACQQVSTSNRIAYGDQDFRCSPATVGFCGWIRCRGLAATPVAYMKFGGVLASESEGLDPPKKNKGR